MSGISFFVGLASALWRERNMTRVELDRYRARRLSTLLNAAYHGTRFWRGRLVEPRHADLTSLSAIAPVSKEEMMASLPETICGGDLSRGRIEAFALDPKSRGRFLDRRYVISTTSGTSGHVGFFVADKASFSALNGALFARVLRDRLCPRDVLRFTFGRRYRMAMVIATDGPFASRHIADSAPWISRAFVDMHTFSILSPMEQTVHGLNRYRPHYLHAYPTVLEALAHERLSARLSIDPEFISMGSEPASDAAKSAIARAFSRAQIVETYGATECIALANQCAAGRLHVNEDLAVLEPVDSDGRPVPEGVPSAKVLITNLVNRTQPLIRYELSDSITVLGDRCPCGSPMASIRVAGRTDDTIWLWNAQGRCEAHPPTRFQALLLELPGLRQYQVVQETMGRLRIRYVVDPLAPSSAVALRIRETIVRYLVQHRAERNVEIAIEQVHEIPRRGAGNKMRQIYSEVSRPTASTLVS